MTSLLEIHIADKPPAALSERTEFHCKLLDMLNEVAMQDGWPTSQILSYIVQDGIVALSITQGGARIATIEDLRIFREEKRKAREAALNAVQQ